MRLCIDCQHFDNLTKKVTGGGVLFTREEFLAWKRADPSRRVCVYCGLDASRLYALGLVNPRTKKRFEVIGVDRIDNEEPTASTTSSRAARCATRSRVDS
jgi:hypothetical protein